MLPANQNYGNCSVAKTWTALAPRESGRSLQEDTPSELDSAYTLKLAASGLAIDAWCAGTLTM
jgi:hypothetical protein